MAYAPYIDSIKELNERLLAQLDEERAKNERRRADAQRDLSQCEIEDAKIEEKRNAILQAQAMQLAYLDNLPAPRPNIVSPPPVQTEARLINPTNIAAVPQVATTVTQGRARVGPQRYLILTSLRAGGTLALGEIIKDTALSERRIRDQLRSDIGDGVVDEVIVGIAHKYRLSKAGGDLLQRFEELMELLAGTDPAPPV
jgi:hypothetical protein